jgi:hypothetical protein
LSRASPNFGSNRRYRQGLLSPPEKEAALAKDLPHSCPR